MNYKYKESFFKSLSLLSSGVPRNIFFISLYYLSENQIQLIINIIFLGVIFSHGPYWRELRRFLLRNLRDFGFGKSSMEDQFLEEVAKLTKTEIGGKCWSANWSELPHECVNCQRTLVIIFLNSLLSRANPIKSI